MEVNMVKTGSIIVIIVSALEIVVSILLLDPVSISYGVILVTLAALTLKNPASKCMSALTLVAALSSLILNFGILNLVFMLLIIIGASVMLAGAAKQRRIAGGAA